MPTAAHDLGAANFWFDCALCHRRIIAADAEAGRLIVAGASEQEWLDASHKPRFATFKEHKEVLAVAQLSQSGSSPDH
jgi:hypothetical protein